MIVENYFDITQCTSPAPEVACFPFLNGVARGLAKLNELPDYVKVRDPDNGTLSLLSLASPGILPSDPLLPVLNIGKQRAISSLVSLIRECQLVPYSFTTDSGKSPPRRRCWRLYLNPLLRA